MKTRTVTLHGTLHGPIWMPMMDAQMPVDENLSAYARRLVNATGSGLVDAVKSVVDGAGDFQHAKLTSDSYIRIAHRTQRGSVATTRERYIEVTALPSLADYVLPDVEAYG